MIHLRQDETVRQRLEKLGAFLFGRDGSFMAGPRTIASPPLYQAAVGVVERSETLREALDSEWDGEAE